MFVRTNVCRKLSSLNYILGCLVLLITSNEIYGQESSDAFQARYEAKELLEAPVKLIPYPREVNWSGGNMNFQSISVKNPSSVSRLIEKELYEIFNSQRVEVNPEANYSLEFLQETSLADEAYKLSVTSRKITVVSATETGQYYALKTLKQLISLKGDSAVLPLCEINDAPAYPLRGFMIDVGRNYQSLELLKEQLDIMADYKLNTFHWHLTDRPAWRIESKIYPQLTERSNHRPSRDPGMYYTYEEIRELINYASERKIQVIPEIDMPGHSDSFITSMGFRMESEAGMEALENILQEFFEEIPYEMAPIIHIGSDEVHIPNPEEFIARMVKKVQSDGREVVVWSPGLKADSSVIRQSWGAMDTTNMTKGIKEIDSRKSYINSGEPMTYVNKIFFKPIMAAPGNEAIGGILCLWPDVNLRKGMDAFKENPVYSGLLTFAWATWTADILAAPQEYWTMMPKKETEAADYFSAFEEYLMVHKEGYFKGLPFSYLPQSDKEWRLAGPFNMEEEKKFLKALEDGAKMDGQDLEWKDARGNTLIITDRFNLGGYYPEAKLGESVYALTYIHSDRDRSVPVWIGFETPMRANRIYTGIAENGSWDINGGKIWLNGQELEGPQWERPGWKPSKQEGWGSKVDQEIPWTTEELYWTREPGILSLKKGWNKVLVKIPGSTAYQNWMFTFVPLEMDGLKFSTRSE